MDSSSDPTQGAKRGNRRKFERWWIGVALLSVLIGAGLRLFPDQFFGGSIAFVTFYPVVAIAALLAGGRAGLLATALSALLADFLLLQPQWTLGLRNASDWTAMVLFLIVGVAISVMAGKLGQAQRREREALEHAREENIRREGEARLAQIANIAPVAIAQVDRESRYKFVNESYSRRFGLAPADCIGKRIPEIVGDEAYASVRPHVDAALRGERVEFEMPIQYRKAGQRHVRCSFVPEFDPARNVIGVIGAIRDVTEQKRTEEALRESAERFGLIFAASSVGKAEADPATGRFLRVNAALCRMTGYSETELLARTFTDITHPEEHALDRERFRKLISGETPAYSCEKRYVRPDGTVVWAEVTVNLVRDAAGRPLRSIAVIQDTTAKKRAEEALRREKERLLALVNSIPDEIWAGDAAGNLELVNPAALTELGNDFAKGNVEAVATRAEAYRSDGTRRPVEEAPLLRALRGETVHGDEEILRTPRGELRHRQVNASPFRNATGEIIGAVAVVRDITEQKRAQEALRANEERLRQAAGLVGLCTYTWKPPTGDLTWDPGIKPMWGLSPDAIINYDVWRAGIHPDDLAMVEERVARSLDPNGDGAYEAEYRVNGADGVQRWISTRGHTEFKDGRPSVHLGVVVEITDRKRGEEALRESEERFRALADGTPVLIWVHGPDAGLRFVNRAWCEFFGVTLEQAVGGRWKPLVHPEDMQGYIERFLKCHAERREFAAQARVRRHDGEWRWVESTGGPRFSRTGEFLGMAGSSVDITERKRAEKVLARDREELEQLVAERTAKLQELVNELEHFSYTITHDMRAPLRAMRGLAEIMTGTDEELSPEERSKFTRRIITAAERMDGLITDALLYSRLVRQELPVGPVDVEKLLRGMLETYPEFQRENADFAIGPLPDVMGNEAGLTQCFSNLLGNAVKFVKPGEKPVVKIWSEVLADDARAGWVRLWVEDNGVGISDAMKPRVFDMFSRGTHARAGTGIGLALVRKVVDRMGGQVGVESEEGKGSRFWVELKLGNGRVAPPDSLTTAKVSENPERR